MAGKVEDSKVNVGGREFFDNGWYGNEEGELELIEALYLLERGKIKLDMGTKEFFSHCSKKVKNFTAIYNVYKDLRERGLPVRIGFRGSDLRVYERGAKPGKADRVKWIVFAASEDYPCEIEQLGKASALAKNIRALALWAVVDNDLDATYYIIQQPKEL